MIYILFLVRIRKKVDYGTVIPWKQSVLKKAYERFYEGSIVRKDMKDDFYDFCAEAGFWLDYANSHYLKVNVKREVLDNAWYVESLSNSNINNIINWLQNH